VAVLRLISIPKYLPLITLHFNRQIRRKLMAKAPSYFWTSAKCEVIHEQVLTKAQGVLPPAKGSLEHAALYIQF
jgi:hypothetical protein